MRDRLAGFALALLVLLGAVAATARAWFPADLGVRVEPYRSRVLGSLGSSDAQPAVRAAEMARFDASFAAHRLSALLHVVPGAVFLVLAPLQFSARIRSRHLKLHRWSGRLLLVAGVMSGLNGLYFGLLMPF